MRYYVKNQNILANCGTRKEPEWVPGIVVEVHFASRPYEIELERESGGKTRWYFGAGYVIDDNRRNRKRKGVPVVTISQEK